MNDAVPDNNTRTLLDTLYAQMAPQHLFPLWKVLDALVAPPPHSAVAPTECYFAASVAERLPECTMEHAKTAPPGDTLAR